MDWVGAAFNPIYTDVSPVANQYLLLLIPIRLNMHSPILYGYWISQGNRLLGTYSLFSSWCTGQYGALRSQDKIYDDFFKRLDCFSHYFKKHISVKQPYRNFDLIYTGDVNKWIKFANTLRLRLAVRISKVDPARAKTEAEAAYASGVMTDSPGDDAL